MAPLYYKILPISDRFMQKLWKNLTLVGLDVANKLSKPKIKVTILKIKSFVEICLQDNGSGIKNSIKENLMEPYQTSKINGTGLGLAISKKIIEDHNGSITINSSKNGTLVLLKLPLLFEKDILWFIIIHQF